MSELKATTIYDAYWKATSNGDNSILVYLKSEADKVIAEKDEEIRHQKYKRCLAMAKWCDTKGDWYYSLGESFRNRVDFYIKWRDKWLELAEKFKEADK